MLHNFYEDVTINYTFQQMGPSNPIACNRRPWIHVIQNWGWFPAPVDLYLAPPNANDDYVVHPFVCQATNDTPMIDDVSMYVSITMQFLNE